MAWNDDLIPEAVVGERPTLIEADYANKLIRAINILGNIQIDQTIPGGKVVYGDDGITLTWEDLRDKYNFNGSIELIDATNVAKKWVVTVEESMIPTVSYVDSDFEVLSLDICVSGSTQTRNFIVGTTATP
jgi:hypothetical protein